MSSAENTKLIATAVGAAFAGAALVYGLLQMHEKEKTEARRSLLSRRISSRPSFLFNDDAATAADSSEPVVLLPHNHEEKMRRRIAARFAVEEDNLTPRRLVTVRVPATSANVGPGCKSFITCFVMYGTTTRTSFYLLSGKKNASNNSYCYITQTIAWAWLSIYGRK